MADIADNKANKAYINGNSIIIQKKYHTTELLTLLRNKCKFTVKVDGRAGRASYFKSVSSLKIVKGKYASIPKFESRAISILRQHNFQINSIHKLNRIKFPDSYDRLKLIDNQKSIINHLIKSTFTKSNILGHVAGVSLQGGTGIGKSYIAYKLLELLKMKTIIITPTTAICGQHYANLVKLYPFLNIGQYNCKNKKDGDVMIFVIDSLLKDQFTFRDHVVTSREYLKRFSFIIFDEPQMYISPKKKKVFDVVGGACTLGLSATYSDAGDMKKWIYQRIGPIYDVSDLGDQIQWNLNTTLVYYDGPPEYTQTLLNDQDTHDYGQTCRMLASDPYRNQLIIDLANKHIDKGVYILTLNVEHVLLLTRALNGLSADIDVESPEIVDILRITQLHYNDIIDYINKNIKTKKKLYLQVFREIKQTRSTSCIDKIYNNMAPKPYKKVEFMKRKVEAIAKNFNKKATSLCGASRTDDKQTAGKTSILVTTFAYGSVGISFKEKTCLILAMSGKRKHEQRLGRVLRTGYDNEISRDVYDIVDNRLWIKGQLSARKKIYRTHNNNKYTKVSYSWEDIKEKDEQTESTSGL